MVQVDFQQNDYHHEDFPIDYMPSKRLLENIILFSFYYLKKTLNIFVNISKIFEMYH